MPGILFVTEGDHAHALRLQLAREVGDRDAGQPEDRIDAVELEGFDDELKAVGFLRMAIDLAAAAGLQRVVGGGRLLLLACSVVHGSVLPRELVLRSVLRARVRGSRHRPAGGRYAPRSLPITFDSSGQNSITSASPVMPPTSQFE